MARLAPIPQTSPLVEGGSQLLKGGRLPELFLASPWYVWLFSLITRLESGAQLLTTETLTGQHASISATPFALGALNAGLYRITSYARITSPASISSSLTVSVGSTDGGAVTSQDGPAITGNTLNTSSSTVFLLRADPSAALTYATTYDSNGTAMQYRLDLIVEAFA